MVLQCKEEVFNWFKELSGAKRIELMCGLVNLCIPLEWRFFATVIENAARRDYASLKEAELKANSPQEFEILCALNWLTSAEKSNNLSIEDANNGSAGANSRGNNASPPVNASSPTNSMDKHLSSVRSKLIVYLCLLSSSNRVCATVAFQAFRKQLCVENLSMNLLGIPTKCTSGDASKIDNTSESSTKRFSDCGFSNLVLDNGFYSEIILLHTLAIHHPAFTFEQQTILAQQLHLVQKWMDAVIFAAAATAHATGVSSGTGNGSQRSSPGTTGPHFAVSNYGLPVMTHPYQQTQQFSHAFQSTNQQQHPQYHQIHQHQHQHQQQQQQQQQQQHQHQQHQYVQYTPHPHVQYPNLSHQLSNMNIASSVTSTQQYSPHVSVTSPPGFQTHQSVSPPSSESSVCLDKRSFKKLPSKDEENQEEGGVNMMSYKDKIVSFEGPSLDNSGVIINGDTGESKKISKESSKSCSSLVSTSSSNSSSPLSSMANSFSSGTATGSYTSNANLEHILKNFRKHKDKLANLSEEELKTMSETDFVKIGLPSTTAAKLRKALSSVNGMRAVGAGDREKMELKLEKQPRKNLSPLVSPSVSMCSEREQEDNYAEDVVHSQAPNFSKPLPENSSAGLQTVSPNYTKSSSISSKWQNSHGRHPANGGLNSTHTSATSPLLNVNVKSQSSKSPLLSSLPTSMVSNDLHSSSNKLGLKAEPSFGGKSNLNKVSWKKSPSFDGTNNVPPSAITPTECPNCARICTCSGSNVSSAATTPSSTPPPNLVPTPQATPPPQPSQASVQLSNPQSVIPPYWFFPLPLPSPGNGYTPGAQTPEQLFHYYYSWALIAASSFGTPTPSISYWPHIPTASSSLSSSIPGLPSGSSSAGTNSTLTAALAAAASFQPAKLTTVSCYNCGVLGHRGNECTQQTLDDALKSSTFNMNFSGTK